MFIILENAIKYSPDNKPITVNFEEPDKDCLTVTIQSTGPYCRTDELSKLGTKDFAGESAQQFDLDRTRHRSSFCQTDLRTA
ncbi:MAG: ATP-binding protein [Butyricicoccaceae bacterium]